VQNLIISNKGYKYKHIIAPLIIAHKTDNKKDIGAANVLSAMILNDNGITLLSGRKAGQDIPHVMALNDNKIDYFHWNDPNKLMNRRRLHFVEQATTLTMRFCRLSRNFAKLILL